MNVSELTAYVEATYGVSPEYLWPEYPQTFIFRHRDNRKWFAVVLDVERAKLGRPGEGKTFLVDVKTGPVLSGSYLGQPGIIRAWHMNKTHWLGALLDGSASDQTIRELLDLSYSLTETPKKRPGSDRRSKQ